MPVTLQGPRPRIECPRQGVLCQGSCAVCLALVLSIPAVGGFVCVQNAGHSQMAALMATHLSGGGVHVRSSGSAPSGQIDPTVAHAMAAIDLDLADAFPSPSPTKSSGPPTWYHHGLRRRLPALARQALPRLGGRIPPTSQSNAPMSYGIYLYMQSIAGRGPGAALGVLAVIIVALGTYFSYRVIASRASQTAVNTRLE